MKLIILLLLFTWPEIYLVNKTEQSTTLVSQYVNYVSTDNFVAYIIENFKGSPVVFTKYKYYYHFVSDYITNENKKFSAMPGEKCCPALYTTCRPGLFYFSPIKTKKK